MRFCVYQGITTLINLAYKNRGHEQVAGTNLNTLRHFLNYEKIITVRMHARGSDDVDNKTCDEMIRKIGNRTNRATTHT
jgi:hypothetical protein